MDAGPGASAPVAPGGAPSGTEPGGVAARIVASTPTRRDGPVTGTGTVSEAPAPTPRGTVAGTVGASWSTGLGDAGVGTGTSTATSGRSRPTTAKSSRPGGVKPDTPPA